MAHTCTLVRSRRDNLMTTTLPLSRPAALGFDGERLARIDRFLAERYVEPGLLPCALLLVARKGELVHKSRARPRLAREEASASRRTRSFASTR